MITKIDATVPIARLAAEIPGARGVFESFGLDYACTGERSLDDAAHAEGIDVETVIASLHRLKKGEHIQSWNDRPLVDLTRYLTEQHHRFIREELAKIAMHLADRCSKLAGAPPELLSVRAAFTRLSEVVLPHLRREEEHVFPAVEELESAWQSAEPPAITAGGLATHVRQLTLQHGTISAQLRTIRDLRLRLSAAEDLESECRSILDDTAMLEAHLHEYIFLENSVLFPRVIALEKQVTAATQNKT